VQRRFKRGTTLVEVLVALLVFSVALGGLVSSLLNIMEVIDLARDTSQATADLRSMLERIRATPFDDILARFPNGTANGPALYPYTDILGNYTISNESVVVTYANTTTDPLEIHVALSWQDKRGRTRSTSMATYRTR